MNKYLRKLFIQLTLCGNSYTEELSRIAMKANTIGFVHRSNRKSLNSKIVNYLKLLSFGAVRVLCFFLNIDFTIVAPHSFGNYGKIIFFLRPDAIVVIDDGITFEYWSEFHELHIMPLLVNNRCTQIIGPRYPAWKILENYKNGTEVVDRAKIVSKLIKTQTTISPSVFHAIYNKSIIVDDGLYSLDELIKLKKIIGETYGFDVVVIEHPARTQSLGKGAIKLDFPLELIACNEIYEVSLLFGNASTVLFNVASFKSDLLVLSKTSGSDDLDNSMRLVGITVVSGDDWR